MSNHDSGSNYVHLRAHQHVGHYMNKTREYENITLEVIELELNCIVSLEMIHDGRDGILRIMAFMPA